MALLSLFGTALAAPQPFAVDLEAGRFEITSWAAPPPWQLRKSDRTCRIGLAWTPEGAEATDRGCPSAVADQAIATVRAWQIRPPVGIGGHQDLGEIWFVYPFEAPGGPSVLVRQSEERRWTLPEGVEPAPYRILAWEFLRYPEEVYKPGAPDVRCVVSVSADLEGYVTNVQVTGCGPPFSEVARGTIADWRFVPPLVDGQPIPSAMTLAATFIAAPPADTGYHPSDESRALWEAGQFGAMTHEDKMWFIKAELLGPSVRDLGLGHVEISLPSDPDLGGRPPISFFDGSSHAGPPPRPLPDHPPVMVVGPPDHEAIEVYEFALPTADALPAGVDHAECPVLVQVDGSREVFSWAERGCDSAIQKIVLETADRWLLRHQGAADPSVRERFHATVVVDRAGSTVTIPADELRTPLSQVPAGVHSRAPAHALARIPPKVPRDRALPSGTCDLTVEVEVSGRTGPVEVDQCPDGFATYATRAVRRWQWDPARQDGVPVVSQTPVIIRFQP